MSAINIQYYHNRAALKSLADEIRIWKKRRKTPNRAGYTLATVDNNVREIRAKIRVLHIAQSLWRAFRAGKLTEGDLQKSGEYVQLCSNLHIDAGPFETKTAQEYTRWRRAFPSNHIAAELNQLIEAEKAREAEAASEREA